MQLAGVPECRNITSRSYIASQWPMGRTNNGWWLDPISISNLSLSARLSFTVVPSHGSRASCPGEQLHHAAAGVRRLVRRQAQVVASWVCRGASFRAATVPGHYHSARRGSIRDHGHSCISSERPGQHRFLATGVFYFHFRHKKKLPVCCLFYNPFSADMRITAKSYNSARNTR